jgi:hypothetical protein
MQEVSSVRMLDEGGAIVWVNVDLRALGRARTFHMSLTNIFRHMVHSKVPLSRLDQPSQLRTRGRKRAPVRPRDEARKEHAQRRAREWLLPSARVAGCGRKGGLDCFVLFLSAFSKSRWRSLCRELNRMQSWCSRYCRSFDDTYKSFHEPYLARNFSSPGDRLRRIATVLECVLISRRCAQRRSAVHPAATVRHRGGLAPVAASCPRSAPLAEVHG